jgi:hypothetical protein
MPVPDAPTSSNSSATPMPMQRPSQGAGAAEKLAQQLRAQAGRWRDVGTTKMTQLAETGKGQFAAKLNDVAEVIESVAEPVEKSYGSSAAGYVRSASNSVRSLSDDLKNKSVEDLVSASRSAIGNNAGFAIGTAALLGFVAARVAKGGLGEQPHGRNTATQNDSPILAEGAAA